MGSRPRGDHSRMDGNAGIAAQWIVDHPMEFFPIVSDSLLVTLCDIVLSIALVHKLSYTKTFVKRCNRWYFFVFIFRFVFINSCSVSSRKTDATRLSFFFLSSLFSSYSLPPFASVVSPRICVSLFTPFFLFLPFARFYASMLYFQNKCAYLLAKLLLCLSRSCLFTAQAQYWSKYEEILRLFTHV